MRPAIKPGLLMAWRDRDTLQLGVDPRRAVALTGAGAAAAVLSLLDGSRDHGQVLAAAQQQGISRAAADRLIGLLAAAGVLQDFPAAAWRALPDGARGRLAGELAAASLAYGHTDGGARVLVRRQEARIRVYGTGAAGTALASLLTASGIGQVSCVGAAPVDDEPGELRPPLDPAPAPGGWTADHRRPAGRGRAPRHGQPPRAGATRRGVRPPGRPTLRGTSAGRRPDLAVLAGGHPPELPGQLVAGGVPHLAAGAAEAIGVVGPLVIPGRTACLGCLELARRDRDPAWPVILAQVAGRTAVPAACSAALAAAVAAQAVGQALAFIDLAQPPDAVRNGTLELVLPGWQWRRRSWAPHPECRCSRRSDT
jgi:hypothetical protein